MKDTSAFDDNDNQQLETADHSRHGMDLLGLFVMNKLQVTDFCELAEEMTTTIDRHLSFDDSADESSESESDWECCGDELSHRLLSAGYKDCMEEAIRFLVEEEQISEQHPVVQNLRDHLEKSRNEFLQSACDRENNNSFRSRDVSCVDVWNTG